MFCAEDGSPLNPNDVSDQFEDLTIAAGLPPIRLHDLRHGAASLMRAAGVDMKVVQETLGHSNMALTANTYTSISRRSQPRRPRRRLRSCLGHDVVTPDVDGAQARPWANWSIVRG